MKVLAVGDVHGDEKFFQRVCRVAAREGCEAILQLGDFGYWEHTSFGRRFLAVAEYELKDKGLNCYFICGNHENHPMLWEKYGIGYMDDNSGIGHEFVPVRENLFYVPRGMAWEWEGTKFLACGGAYSVDKDHRLPGESWWATETITDEQVEACERSEAHVVVSHDVPWGFELPAMAFKNIFPESALNRKQLGRIVDSVQPNLLLHGHYHHRFGNWHKLHSGKTMRIEGLGANLDGNEKAWLMLDLQRPGGELGLISVPNER